MAHPANYFAGKRALVTGGTRGIGLEIVRALHKKGAHVIAVGRDKALLEDLAREMPSVFPLCLDISDWNETKKALSSVLPIDMLVNNAGVAFVTSFGNFEETDVDKLVAVNYKAVFNISQIVAKDMISRKSGGSIVMMSSTAALRPLDEHALYCSAKAAVDMLMRTMALELGKHNIRVNSVNPTVTMTDMGKKVWSDPAKSQKMLNKIPLHRFAEISDVVKATLFLLSDDASYLNGVILPVDGGMTAV